MKFNKIPNKSLFEHRTNDAIGRLVSARKVIFTYHKIDEDTVWQVQNGQGNLRKPYLSLNDFKTWEKCEFYNIRPYDKMPDDTDYGVNINEKS